MHFLWASVSTRSNCPFTISNVKVGSSVHTLYGYRLLESGHFYKYRSAVSARYTGIGIGAFLAATIALQVLLSAGRDCLIAGDTCSSDETCSPRLRTLRQCVAGNGSMKLGPGARSQCANAVSALLSSPLYGCQCRRGMKKEKNCLSIYWSLHQSGIHGE
ncbi:hypothetical protein cypCar_00025063 [Cyprinus carpio]|nr:hypothetical protein cypCar_00025063 [Cyprinus carpio]